MASIAILLVLVTSVRPPRRKASTAFAIATASKTGKITKMSALGVTLTKSGIKTKKPVEEILSITFAGQPPELTPARRAIKAGRFELALKKLSKIDRDDVERNEIKQEIDFLTTFCNVQHALAGQGSLDRAKKQVTRFLSKNSKSYRVPEAIELLGDVLLASQDYAGARAQYSKLGKAPAPYFKARSAMLTGRSLQAEGNHEDAVAAFDLALKAAEGNAVAQSQVLEATLHRAVSQSALGNDRPVDQCSQRNDRQRRHQRHQVTRPSLQRFGRLLPTIPRHPGSSPSLFACRLAVEFSWL